MKLNITSRLLSLMAIVAALTFTSCGDKDDDAQPVIDQTACKLTKVDSNGEITVAEYNANGYISKMTETTVEGGEEDIYVTKYTYDNSNKLIKEEYIWNGESDGYVTYEYANGLISKSKSYYDGALDYTATYTYDANKRVTKITESEAGSEEEYSMNFTYTGAGNVAQMDLKFMDEVFISTKFENYDNKLSPQAAVKGLANIYEGSSKNNPGKITSMTYWSEEPTISVSNYTYVYNSNNLPTKITETDEDGTYISNLTYQCN